MKHLRPIPRDNLGGDGQPIVASRAAVSDRAAPRGPTVTHSYAAVSFYTAGSARVEQGGHWRLGEGDVLLVPAGGPHRVLEMQRAEYWWLGFCVPCFAADSTATLLEPLERVRDGAASVVHIPTGRHGFLEGLFRELRDLGSDVGAPSRAALAIQRSLLTLILAEIDRAARSSASRGTPTAGVVAESLRFIERNCLRRLTVDEVAAAVGRSPTYVTTALTQATGRSANDWIVGGRMAEARRLLLHSDEKVDIIAERVGYADPTHFIRMFRRSHGATPAAWRASSERARRALLVPTP